MLACLARLLCFRRSIEPTTVIGFGMAVHAVDWHTLRGDEERGLTLTPLTRLLCGGEAMGDGLR